MKKALIIFGSTTGNTETMSERIENALGGQGVETEIKYVTDASIEDLTSENNLLLLGCPAYGDEEIELQEDFEEFYEQLDGVNLNGKKFAVFAPGDSSYEHFCGSVDMLEDKMKELGGELVAPGLKVDADPDDYLDDINEWSQELSNSI